MSLLYPTIVTAPLTASMSILAKSTELCDVNNKTDRTDTKLSVFFSIIESLILLCNKLAGALFLLNLQKMYHFSRNIIFTGLLVYSIILAQGLSRNALILRFL